VPVQPIIYELDAEPAGPAELAGPTSPVDEDDQALALAIERSQFEAFAPPQRSFTGTDEDELARAISLSLLEV
jgi:hypothetical protein